MPLIPLSTEYPIRPFLRLINSLFLSFIFQTYALNIQFPYSTYFTNVVYIYLIQWLASRFTQGQHLSSLPYALKNRMRDYPAALEQWKIKQEIITVLLTILIFIIMLSIFSWRMLLTLHIETSHNSDLLLSFNFNRLKLFIPTVSLYIGFLYCAIISYHDITHQIKRPDSELYRFGTVVTLLLLVGIILLSW